MKNFNGQKSFGSSITGHTFHCHLSKSFLWYRNWHKYSRHHHVHWSLFIIFAVIISSFTSRSIGDFYFENDFTVQSVQAQSGLTITQSGERWAVNGSQKFLLLASYFGGLGASQSTLNSDFAALRSKGFDGVRILVNWPCVGCDNDNGELYNDQYRLHSYSTGNYRSGMLARLQNFLQTAQDNNLIVDLTFMDAFEFASFSAYRTAIENTTRDTKPYRNVIFDLQNEAGNGCSGRCTGSWTGGSFLDDSFILTLRNAVKAIDSNRLVTASFANSDIGWVSTTNIDYYAPHGPERSTNWPANTDDYVNSARSQLPRPMPIYLGEPERYRGTGQYNDSADDWFTAAKNAKCAGASAWTFHNGENDDNIPRSYDLTVGTLFSQFNSVENQIANGLASQLNSTAWFSCATGTSSSPSPTPTTSSPPPSSLGPPPYGKQGDCPSGYITLADANASTADPSITNGYWTDDDSPVATQVTYPVQAILVCDDSQPESTAFAVNSSYAPSNCRPSDGSSCNYDPTQPFDKYNNQPGWNFIGGDPYRNGSPVPLIKKHNCASGSQSSSFTISNSSVEIGAWTTKPSTNGAACIRGTVLPAGCSLPPGDNSYCAQCGPCDAGEGDCDGDIECSSGSTCVSNVGPNYGWSSATDVCEASGSPPPPSASPPPPSASPPPPPIIYYVYPNRVQNGGTLIVSGVRLVATVEFFDAIGNSYTYTGNINSSATEVLIPLPSFTTGTYTVRVVTGSNVSNSVAFEVIPGIFTQDPSALSPPVITTIYPTIVSQGGSFQIVGSSLTPNVQFFDINGVPVNITGAVSSDLTTVTVATPSTLQPGIYTVGITGPFGSAVSQDVLTITDSQVPPGPAAAAIDSPFATDFQELISGVFDYAILVVGIAVFVMILWAGFLWLTAGANPGNISTAKKIISNAIIGAILLLSAYVILYTINPELVGGGFTLPAIQAPAPITNQPPISGTLCPNNNNSLPDSGCSGCVTMSFPGIPRKAGVGDIWAPNPKVATSVETALVLLNEESIRKGVANQWQVTEAYCPTVSHLDKDHYNGRAVDIALLPAAKTVANVKNLCLAAAAATFSITNEYVSMGNQTSPECPAPLSSSTTTGDHLHLEK